MTKTPYEQARQMYWDAQTGFRQYAMAEFIRLIPEGISAVLLDFNDADPPRLSVAQYRDNDGQRVDPDEWSEEHEGPEDESLFHTLDEIASDMEYAHWDEASGSLFRTDDNMYFIIRKDGAY